jgi:hypothetical protein
VKPRDFEPVRPFNIQGRPYIDETGDFRTLTEPAKPRNKIESLAKAIEANRQATYRELVEATGIPQKSIAKVAAKSGYQKEGEEWKRKILLS